MDFSLTGLAAVGAFLGFVIVLAAPVWLAARVVGAARPTLLRSIGSLMAGTVGVFILAVVTGPWVFLLAPLSYLFAFKWILGTSFLGSIALAILAGLGYATLGYFMGGATTFTPPMSGTWV